MVSNKQTPRNITKEVGLVKGTAYKLSCDLHPSHIDMQHRINNYNTN